MNLRGTIPQDMDAKTVQKRILAAQELLQKGTLDASTLPTLKTLLYDIHPRLNIAMDTAVKAGSKITHLQKGEVISLALDSIPDLTPQDKKRKKIILLFLGYWNTLKSEVARVEKEIGTDFSTKSFADKAGSAWNILGAAKGPLGLITLVAVGVVALKTTEVSVAIHNIGCEPIEPATSVAINIPGLKLPSQSILAGGESVAKLPPLRVHVDASQPTGIRLVAYGMTYNFPAPDRSTRLVFDDVTINGTSTDIDLGSQKQHVLRVECK